MFNNIKMDFIQKFYQKCKNFRKIANCVLMILKEFVAKNPVVIQTVIVTSVDLNVQVSF